MKFSIWNIDAAVTQPLSIQECRVANGKHTRRVSVVKQYIVYLSTNATTIYDFMFVARG